MARNFSMTNDSVPVVEIVEPLTLIRQDLRIKESALTESISEFLEFIMKQEVYDHSTHNYDEKTCPICLKFSIPYCLRSENRSEYKPLLQTIEKALTYSITTAKRIRQELYSTPNEEVKYDMPNTAKLPTNEIPDQSKLKQALGMKKTVHFDPNSPMAKMEELVQGLTEILFIFKRWLKWFEGLILEGLMFNTPTSLQSELNQLIEIFGTDIEPNIWIAFQFHRDLREQDAERHAVSVATALQKQEDRERNDMSNMMPNPSR
jgi:hypothetical protein